MSKNRIEDLARSIQCQYHWTETDIENFGKLIIDHCLQIIETSKIGYNQVPAEIALDMTAKNIKSYFGIE